MRILVITIGSAGDVHPFIALGLELKRRGHQITLYTTDYFEADIRKAGLDFAAMSPREDFTSIMEHPDLWHPIRGFQLLYTKVFIPMMPPVYQFIQERYVAGETGVVTSTLGFGARAAQEKLGVPTVSVHLQPTVFRSMYDTPVYPGVRMGPGMPRWLKRAVFRLMDFYMDRVISSGMNAFRREKGLDPVFRIFKSWIHSPECVLGFFPEWFAPPQPDWPPHAHATGFPLFDGVTEHPLAAETRQFLEAGEPPVIFTAGSAMKQGQWFFRAAVDACRILKCRGLLINKFRDQVPADLPSGIAYAEYAPFSQVFSKARAVVHHGGIGTTAQVFAAGVPQVIVPLAFDQPDQAMRVERLGAGLPIRRADFQGGPLAEVLRKVLDDSQIQERCKEYAVRLNGRRDIAAACDLIELTFRKKVLNP